jgi:hypothetical protein
MALETDYINPNVILTTRVSQQLQDWIKYIHCAGLILLTFFLSAYEFSLALRMSLATAMLWGGVVWYLKRRPTIVLEGQDRKIQLAGLTKFGRAQSLPGKLVEKVTVMADIAGRERGQYIPQLVLRSLKGKKKKLVISCFPLEDIVQAHYAAQLLASFSHADAFDFKGNTLPPLSTHIPNRFLAGKGQSLKSVSSAMKKAKAQKKAEAAKARA